MVRLFVVVSHLVCMAAAVPRPAYTCSDVSFTLHASAANDVFLGGPDPNNATSISNWFDGFLLSGTLPIPNGTTTVSGTFTIAGHYCKPPGKAARGVLQILVHGLTYNKSMWSGLGFGSTYNWPLFAATQGYHTLAIDRIGHGANQQHPDALSVVQGALHTEVIHQLVAKIRKGTAGLPSAFHKIIYVGHSYGSFVGNALSRTHPADADAIVLTGYSAGPDEQTVGIYSFNLAPAVTVNSKRFAGVPPGYLTNQNESSRETAFYGGSYDPAIPKHDFAVEDTGSLGEYAEQTFGFLPSSYTGPVLVVAGANDSVFCDAAIGPCDTILNQTGALFPNASAYTHYVAPNTGHVLTLHYSAPTTMGVIHTWLNKHFPV